MEAAGCRSSKTAWPAQPQPQSEDSQDGEGEGGRKALSGVHLVGAEDDEGAGGRGAEHHHDLGGLDQGDPPLVVALLGTDLRREGKGEVEKGHGQGQGR